MKRRLIADPVWKSIEFFDWESQLLNSFLIDRLHHIVQNSCAYKVFPGLKYSRFVHSIGVMHVATKIFLNAVVNSEEKYLNRLLAEAVEIDKCFEHTEGIDAARRHIQNLTGCDQRLTLLLGALRVCALTHDLGHLPYSHIFEFALEAFLMKQNVDELNEDVVRLQQNLVPIFLRERKLINKPHEVLGHNLVRSLILEFSDDHDLSPQQFLHAAEIIWFSDKTPISRSIIEGDIDADRIDFVTRDGKSSGMYSDTVDYSRLFASFTIGEYDDGTGHSKIHIRPSNRASAETEKLIWFRFQDYKYIASHHKVHLFDEILVRIIFFLTCNGYLNQFLQAIGTLLIPSQRIRTIDERMEFLNAKKTVLKCFLDSWLDVTIRDVYDRIGVDDEAKRYKALVNTLYEKRDLFCSLFKTDEDYQRLFPALATGGQTAKIAGYLVSTKYELEEKLEQQIGVPVIIGDLAHKLRIGIKNRTIAKTLCLTDMYNFLDQKFASSRPFHVWYYSPTGRDKVIDETITRFLSTKIEEVVSAQSKEEPCA